MARIEWGDIESDFKNDANKTAPTQAEWVLAYVRAAGSGWRLAPASTKKCESGEKSTARLRDGANLLSINVRLAKIGSASTGITRVEGRNGKSEEGKRNFHTIQQLES